MEVIIDQGDVTPKQGEILESYGVKLQKRDPHPRRGSYKYGYYVMNSSTAEKVKIPKEYWSVVIQ